MNLMNFMSNIGVNWPIDELKKYKAREEAAINGSYGKTTVYTSSAPTSGPQLVSLLNILSGFDTLPTDHLTVDFIHEIVETMRITQNQVSQLGIDFIYPFIFFKVYLKLF